jgi:hypothetical protein
MAGARRFPPSAGEKIAANLHDTVTVTVTVSAPALRDARR